MLYKIAEQNICRLGKEYGTPCTLKTFFFNYYPFTIGPITFSLGFLEITSPLMIRSQFKGRFI